MFVMYGPIGDGPEWRATRGKVSQDFKTSAMAYAGALRLAGGNKGKLRRARYAAPPAPAPTPAAKKKAKAKKKKAKAKSPAPAEE